MSNQASHDELNTMRDRLRDEALAERPAFSPELHDRLLRAVFDARARAGSWEAGAGSKATGPQTAAGLQLAGRAAMWLVAAAATLAALAVALRYGPWQAAGDRADDRQVADAALHTLPAPGASLAPHAGAPTDEIHELTVAGSRAVERLRAALETTFIESGWAYVDYDLREAALHVTAHVPDELAALVPLPAELAETPPEDFEL